MASLRRRESTFYLQYYIGRKQKRVNLRTDSLQIAKEKLRQFESAQARGDVNPLATRTPLTEVVGKYVDHIRAIKTPKSAQNEVYYLREAFGPISEQLCVTSRIASLKTRKRRPKTSEIDRRRKLPVIESNTLEEITTAQIAQFIDFKVRDQGLKPKTANHYRSIIRRLINWAIEHLGIRLSNGINPAVRVRPFKESAPEIRFLTLRQIKEQLDTLRFKPQLQTMVAVLIYTGLRREELLWLTADDIDLRRHNGSHGLIRVRAKTINGRFWEPKTKRNRVVPISRTLREYLDRYTPANSDHVWYFPSPEGKWWDPDNFATDLRRANRETGLPWGCLDYRHTFGSHLAQKGVSLYKISRLMGNSPEICRLHYAALVPEALTAEVEFGSRSCTSGQTNSAAS